MEQIITSDKTFSLLITLGWDRILWPLAITIALIVSASFASAF